MKKLYNVIAIGLNVCTLLWYTHINAMYTSARPRPAGQPTKKRLEQKLNPNFIAIQSSQSTSPSNTVFINKNIVNMSDTLKVIVEGLGDSPNQSITFDLFSTNTIKPVLALLQNYYELKNNPRNITKYTELQQKIEHLSLEQLINGTNMLDFLSINDSECPLMNMFMDRLTNTVNNLSPTEVAMNKELLSNLNLASSELLGKKIISLMRIAILKHQGIGKENILPEPIKLNYTIGCLAYSNDGKRIALTPWNPPSNNIFIFDAEKGQLLATLPYQKHITSISFSHDDKKIISTHDSYQNNLIVWDAINYTLLDHLHGHADRVETATFSPDDKIIVSASYGDQDNLIVWKWDTSRGTYIKEQSLSGHQHGVRTVDISHDGKHIISGPLRDCSILLRNTEDYTIEDRLIYKTDDWTCSRGISLLKFSPNDINIIALYAYDPVLWNAKTRKIQYTMRQAHSPASTFSPDSNIIALARANNHGDIALYHTQTGEKICDIKQQNLSLSLSGNLLISSMHFINNGNTLAISTRNNKKPLLMINLLKTKEQEMLDKLKKQPLLDQITTLSIFNAI